MKWLYSAATTSSEPARRSHSLDTFTNQIEVLGTI
jgi:hypothetical protein